ncbi:hypothetical protein ACHAXS_011909 [Conticribra weissflogii]
MPECRSAQHYGGREFLHDDTDEHHRKQNQSAKIDDENDDDRSISSIATIDSCEAFIDFTSIRDPTTRLEERVSFTWPGVYEDGKRDEVEGENGTKKTLRKIVLSTLLEEDDLAPLFDGSRWAGTRLWGAAVRAIQYISTQPELMPTGACASEIDQMNNNITMLELGCGLGVPGMIYHMLGGSVVLTDQANILSQLEKNVMANFPETCVSSAGSVVENVGVVATNPDCNEKKNHIIRAMPLSWSRDDVCNLLRALGLSETGFDIVLNCDCVYEPLYGKSWKLLLETIDELLRVNPKCKVVTSVERRQADGIDKFLAEMNRLKNVGGVEKAMSDEDKRIEIFVTTGVIS